jgi:hypothetical protein
MKSLTDLLLNHKVPGVREAQARHTIAEVISNKLGIAIGANKIQYEKGDLVITVPPVIKSAIRLKEIEIRDAIVQQ